GPSMNESAKTRTRATRESVVLLGLATATIAGCSEESRGEPNDNSTRGPFSTGGDFGDGDSTHSGGSGLGGAASSPSGGASSFPGGGSGGESTNGSGGTTEPGAVYAFPG